MKLKGENILFGMNKFSLQTPASRNYIYEWIFHKLLKKEGLPALRYTFVQLDVNGKDQGIYAVEEHFDKRLIESNQYKEGPILKYDESLYYLSYLRNLLRLESYKKDGDLRKSQFWSWRPKAFK